MSNDIGFVFFFSLGNAVGNFLYAFSTNGDYRLAALKSLIFVPVFVTVIFLWQLISSLFKK